MQVVIVSLVSFGVGVGILVTAATWEWVTSKAGLQNVLNNLGGTVVTSVALFLVWDLVGRRSFKREMLDTVQYAADLEDSGVVRVGTDYLREPDWNDLFRSVTEIDIFFAYGSTWRNNHHSKLVDFLGGKNSRLRVVLPDPEDEATVRVLSQRFSMTSDKLADSIREAVTLFTDLSVTAAGEVQVYARSGDSLFSYYRFDGKAVVTMYAHEKKRKNVPVVVCQKGGSLHSFFTADFDALLKEGKRIAPKEQPKGE
ncbi:hypothetical protein [Actinokineospora bangkokensis]|uniref:hypothetical protein n=1 Tax=Actinokineospora bangkokensis TaxID=1193682 RepID=UPI001177C9BA|nr:hypothetical protein [Actinokineospora bangkokensis]